FAVQLNEYSVHGQHRRAVNANLTLPSSILPSVVSVNGLSQSLSRRLSSTAAASPAAVPPPAGFRNAQPCSAYYREKIVTKDPAYNGRHLPYAPCGYKPAQLRLAYGIASAVNKGIDGRGQTVAIIDWYASPTLYSDAAEYAARND